MRSVHAGVGWRAGKVVLQAGEHSDDGRNGRNGGQWSAVVRGDDGQVVGLSVPSPCLTAAINA
jgi:hypothetical protein